MAQNNIPYLTGGLLFDLLLEARKTRQQARANLQGETDGLSDPNVLESFIYVVNGEETDYKSDTLGKSTTLYKTCQIDANTYLPFNDSGIISAFDSDIKKASPVLVERMNRLVKNYIHEQKYEWLAKALIETICNDTAIPSNIEFKVAAGITSTKENLAKVEFIEIEHFLLSVMHFILMRRPNNILGRPTFETWYKQSSPKAAWKFCNKNIGKTINHVIAVVSTALDDNDTLEEDSQIPSDKVPFIFGSDGIAPDLATLQNGNIYLIDKYIVGELENRDEFDVYIRKAKEDYSDIKTLLNSEAPHLFKDLYVCNDLCVHTTGAPIGTGQKISNITVELLAQLSKRIIISGTGGIGKSMMMKHLFFDAANNFHKDGILPILVSLKDFTPENKNLLNFVYKEVCAFDANIQLKQIKNRLEIRKCILLLDGYDELTSDAKDIFNKALANLIKAYPEAIIVISSRPRSTFLQLRQFTVVDILPFDISKALELVDKLEYHDKAAKAKFRRDLSQKLFRTHEQFASNPLLLTIMLMTYAAYGEVPAKQHIFYAKAYETMSRLHDASKGAFVRPMYTKLSPDDFAIYFSEFCARTYRAHCLEFSEKTFADYMNPVIKRLNRRDNVVAQDFRKDLVDNLCIMYEESLRYHFIHRSFQEYFCAVFFSNQMDDKLWKIGDFFETQKTRFYSDHTFDMLYDMIPDKIDRFIFLPFLQNLWAECDAKDGYWTYLEKMFSTIYAEAGDPGQVFENEADSYLYDFFLHITGIRSSGELYNLDWPDSIKYCETDEWVSVPRTYVSGTGETVTRYETMTFREWEDTERNIFETDEEVPEIEGASIKIDISEIRSNPTQYQDLMKFMEQDDFLLKREYNRARYVTEIIYKKANKKVNEDDWFDDF